MRQFTREYLARIEGARSPQEAADLIRARAVAAVADLESTGRWDEKSLVKAIVDANERAKQLQQLKSTDPWRQCLRDWGYVRMP